MFAEITAAIGQMFSDPMILVATFLGTALGVVLGAFPGLGSTSGTALFIPITYAMIPNQAFVFLGGLYVGAVYAGQIPAILYRIPGASEAVMTVLDGYELTKKGKSDIALGVGLFASVVGSLVGVIALMVITIPLASVALKFGPAEYFALAILGLTAISSLGGGDVIKGLISGLIGLLLATMGIDALSGIGRFVFGSRMLLGGISFIPAVIGLFAVSEVFKQVYSHRNLNEIMISATPSNIKNIKKKIRIRLPSNTQMWRIAPIIIVGIIVGIWFGVLPGTGATTAAIIGYSVAIRMSKHPEKFGTGIVDGIAATESANNAAVGAAMVPMLALGIPGSATTAVILGAFMLHGLTPGPLFLINERPLFFIIVVGMMLASILIIPLGFWMANIYLYFSKISYPILAVGILVFTGVGARTTGDYYGMIVMYILGLVGFVLESNMFKVGPMVLGIVLGPLAESSLRRALIISGGNWLPIITRPITAFLLILALISLSIPLMQSLKKKSIDGEKGIEL